MSRMGARPAPAWSPGKHGRDEPGRGGPVRFNGAPAWSPGKLAGRDLLDADVRKASMEPRLGRRGNRRPSSSPGTRRAASMEPRLGRRGNTGRSAPGRWRSPCFNGAPAWSPGKHPDPPLRRGDPGDASMEPRLGRRGNTAAAWANSSTPACFNGAPAWSPGKPRRGRPPGSRRRASMEPRLGRRGNARASLVRTGLSSFNGAPAWSPGKPAPVRAAGGEAMRLQWSPGLVAGETCQSRCRT